MTFNLKQERGQKHEELRNYEYMEELYQLYLENSVSEEWNSTFYEGLLGTMKYSCILWKESIDWKILIFEK